jgi:hypothetical protein
MGSSSHTARQRSPPSRPWPHLSESTFSWGHGGAMTLAAYGVIKHCAGDSPVRYLDAAGDPTISCALSSRLGGRSRNLCWATLRNGGGRMLSLPRPRRRMRASRCRCCRGSRMRCAAGPTIWGKAPEGIGAAAGSGRGVVGNAVVGICLCPTGEVTISGCGRRPPRFWSGESRRRRHAAGVSRLHDAWPRHA